jgi:hypothetical protein
MTKTGSEHWHGIPPRVHRRRDVTRRRWAHLAGAPTGRWCGLGESEGKQEADPIGSAEVQIVANHGLKEMSALHRARKHLREAHFHLLEREPMRVAGG